MAVIEEEKPAWKFIQPRYPHMGPIEARIWSAFLEGTDLTFTKIEYDVRVGPGNMPSYSLPEDIANMWKSLTQLRIDAVGHRVGEIWIFEVKPRAGRSGLGQLLAYKTWYQHDYKPMKPIRLGIVCQEIDQNMIEVYKSYGIDIFQVLTRIRL